LTVDQLAKELHELKRRRDTPLPLIEMFDALLSLAPGLSPKTEAQASRRDHGYGIETAGTQGRLIATEGWRGRQRNHLTTGRNNRPEWPQRLVCARCGSRTLDMGGDRDRAAIARNTRLLNLPADRYRPFL
jgi:hypothetical protein